MVWKFPAHNIVILCHYKKQNVAGRKRQAKETKTVYLIL